MAELIVAAHEERDAIPERFRVPGFDPDQLDAFALDFESPWGLNDAGASEGFLQQQPGYAEGPLVLDPGFHFHRFADLGDGLAASPAGEELRDPGVGEVAAQQQDAEQDVHGIDQQAEFQEQSQQQQDECADHPFHSA